MKIPCELVVWYVLPAIRKDLARKLVDSYGMSQTEVAKRFGVTGAAISQYLKRKRGQNLPIGEDPANERYREGITQSAERIAQGKADFADEMCRMCCVVKQMGILAKIYKEHTGLDAPACACETQIPL